MIVAMKKICCICQAKDGTATLAQLRGLGVVHVEHQQAPQGKDITILQENISLALAAEGIITRHCQGIEKFTQKQSADWKITGRHIIDLEKRLDQLKEYAWLLKKSIAEWQRWGDFDPKKIEELTRQNIFIRFYQIPLKEIASLPEGLIVKNIFVSGGLAHCLVISRIKREIAYKEILLPKVSLSTMRYKLEEDSRVEETLEKDLVRHVDHYAQIQQQRLLLEKELKFQQALKGMGQSMSFAYLVGYAPFDACDMLQRAAQEKQWAISIQDPSDEDNVPTFIRNPRWVSLIKPVLGLLGITPGYHELDVSALFLVFFSIFFGILIGDAGYGLVYLCLTIWMQKKMRKNPALGNVFSLFYLLSSCAIIWGALTGMFFGQEWLLKKGFKPLVPFLNDVKFMQSFCFFIGALHLSIAHSWRAALKFPSLAALADIGWICVLWTAFFLARTLILSEVFPSWGMGLVSIGITLVILFTNPQRNMLKAIGEGLGTVALSLMNNFTDVVSYVRLFAVGLATVAIAETVNTMATGLGHGAVAAAAGVLIVLIGHGLNIVLGPMSVLVHGVRLNVLEFSGHASVTWSGEAYNPFRE